MMQDTQRFLPILFFLFVALSISAQSFDRPNGFGGQVLLIDHSSFADGNSFGLDELTTGFEFSYSRHLTKFISVRVPFKGGLINATELEFGNNRSFVGLDFTVQATYFGDENKIAPFVYTGFGGTKEESVDIYTQIPVGAGINIRIGPWGFFQIKAEYRSDLKNEFERTNLQYGLGLVAVVGPTLTTKEIAKMLSDTDGDGIDDDIDRCPDVAGRKQFGGCLDADNDGIGDGDDSCPDEPGLLSLNGCPDSDSDGVADIVDDCPDTPGTASGCPDADEDGIADAKDKCPDIAGPEGFLGCPEAPEGMEDVAAMDDNLETEEAISMTEKVEDMQAKGGEVILVDTDLDGFSDAEDECPNTSGPAAGCPDADADGVADRFDACPNVSGSLSGCPDSDADGIADYKDNCPDSKGSASNMGCPEVAASNDIAETNATYNSSNSSYTENYSGNTVITDRALTLMSDATRSVQFRTLSDDITGGSYSVLEQIVELMIDNPNYRLKVSGHTDDRGEDSVNQRLSEKRARACVRFLRDRGVPELQMSYIGYGARIPVSDNDTDYGRSENRRVEFELFTVN